MEEKVMTRKNKLYKHHKSESYFYIKDFSFAIAALIGIGAAIAVPTYIAANKTEDITLKADENSQEEVEDNTEESELVVTSELLHF